MMQSLIQNPPKSATMAPVLTAAPTDGAPLVALRRLDRRFGAAIHALKAIDPTFEQGGIQAIVGKNPTASRRSANS